MKIVQTIPAPTVPREVFELEKIGSPKLKRLCRAYRRAQGKRGPIRIVAMSLILLLSTIGSAQQRLTYDTTPPGFTTLFQEYGGDGSVYTVLSVGGNQKYFPLPWGLDFAAGWEVLVGVRTRDLDGIFNSVPAWGGSLYAMKFIGGDGAFVRISARGMFDADEGGASRFSDQRFRATLTFSIGWRTSN